MGGQKRIFTGQFRCSLHWDSDLLQRKRCFWFTDVNQLSSVGLYALRCIPPLCARTSCFLILFESTGTNSDSVFNVWLVESVCIIDAFTSLFMNSASSFLQFIVCIALWTKCFRSPSWSVIFHILGFCSWRIDLFALFSSAFTYDVLVGISWSKVSRVHGLWRHC